MRTIVFTTCLCICMISLASADEEKMFVSKEEFRTILRDSTCHYSFSALTFTKMPKDTITDSSYAKFSKVLSAEFGEKLVNWHEADSLVRLRLSNWVRVYKNKGGSNLDSLSFVVNSTAAEKGVKYLVCFYDFNPAAHDSLTYAKAMRQNTRQFLSALSSNTGSPMNLSPNDNGLLTLEIRFAIFDVMSGKLLYQAMVEENEAELEPGLKELAKNVLDTLKKLMGGRVTSRN